MRLSWSLICKECQKRLLKPTLRKRRLDLGIEVYSFYSYSEIKTLLKSKESYIGDRVLKILARNSFLPFLSNIGRIANEFAIVPIDCRVKRHFSHTAVLGRVCEKAGFNVWYGALTSRSGVEYGGKGLRFRRSNPKRFIYRPTGLEPIVIVDDIIASGETISQAAKTAGERSNVLFAMVLADAAF